MEDYKIEKGVEIPAKRFRSRKYPFAKMEIGDSFFVKRPDGINLHNLQVSLHNAGKNYAKAIKAGLLFITRCENDGVRIWRIS